MIKYIVLIGLPGSGKTTLSKIIQKKLKAPIYSIDVFRRMVHKYLPIEEDMVKEDIAWAWFKSKLRYARLSDEDKYEYALVNLCGVNWHDKGILELYMKGIDFKIKLVCDRKVLRKRIKKKTGAGWFPYNCSREDIIGFGMKKWAGRSDLRFHTDKMSARTCVRKIFELIEYEEVLTG